MLFRSISKGKKKKNAFFPLIEKIRARFSGWNLNLMSQAGKIVLIQSVLMAMPVYILQAVNPPKSVICEIEGILARFFWGSTSEKRRIHWTTWRNICFPHSEQGLNILSIADIAQAFSMKLWFNFRKNSSLWASFMHKKYSRNKAFECLAIK